MANQTTNLKLIKPLDNEFYNVNVFNNNADIIDTNITQNTTDITSIQTDLSVTENSKYTTVNGIKEFECKDGYVDNIIIEGETLVNLFSTNLQIESDRLSSVVKYSANTFTLINLSNKQIVQSTTKNNAYYKTYSVQPNSSNIVTLESNEYLQQTAFLFSNGWTSSDLEVAKKSLVIIEGSHINKNISYFEGLKSVGQGDKIEVLTRSDEFNLFDGKSREGYYSGGIFKYNLGDFANINPIPIKPNMEYISSSSRDIENQFIRMNWYDSNMNYISQNASQINTSPSNAKFMNIHLAGAKNVIINEGSVIKSDLSKYDKKQILTTLRSLPSGLKDEIIKQGDKYYKIKKNIELTLNGGENWTLATASSTNTISCALVLSDCKGDSQSSTTVSNIYCDKFNPSSPYDRSIDKELVTIANFTSEKQIFIRIAKSKLTTTQDLAGFKTWLSQNPVTVVYELATPIQEELPNFNPRTFSDKSTILLNTGVVQGEASFEVTNSMRSELEVLKSIASDLCDYVNPSKIDFSNRCNFLNGWNVWGGSSYLSAYLCDNQVKICILLSPGTKTISTKILKVPTEYIPSSLEFITAIDNNGKVYSFSLNAEGYIKNEILINDCAWVSINFSYPLPRK